LRCRSPSGNFKKTKGVRPTTADSPMPLPRTPGQFLTLVRKSGVVEPCCLEPFEKQVAAEAEAVPDPQALATAMVRQGLLSYMQADALLRGKWRHWVIAGKYRLLEQLGVGGIGKVFLCEHLKMQRLVALKIMQPEKAANPLLLARFVREAKTLVALHHPNIVRAFDLDNDGRHHFIVLEYVDGASLQHIVSKHGPLTVVRACDYVRQAALGLQYAHENGLVHRDIKPANLLLDRTGVVKIHDLGLARILGDEQEITQILGNRELIGTADYLAPEQAVDSHAVDIRADIYSLGGVFFYLLTGRSPFADGTVAQKLLDHQTRLPDGVRKYRNDTPAGVEAIVSRMLAKNPRDRFQQPIEIVTALARWTRVPAPLPHPSEMPRMSRAVRRLAGPVRAASPPSADAQPPQRLRPDRTSPHLRRRSGLVLRLVAIVGLGLFAATALYSLGRWNAAARESPPGSGVPNREFGDPDLTRG
jgi:serine/threonine protein kinase